MNIPNTMKMNAISLRLSNTSAAGGVAAIGLAAIVGPAGPRSSAALIARAWRGRAR